MLEDRADRLNKSPVVAPVHPLTLLPTFPQPLQGLNDLRRDRYAHEAEIFRYREGLVRYVPVDGGSSEQRLRRSEEPVQEVGQGDQDEDAYLSQEPMGASLRVEPLLPPRGRHPGEIIQSDHDDERGQRGVPPSPEVGGRSTDRGHDGLPDLCSVHDLAPNAKRPARRRASA